MKTKRKINTKKHRSPKPETVGCPLSQIHYSNRFPYEAGVSDYVFYLKSPHFDPPLSPFDPPPHYNLSNLANAINVVFISNHFFLQGCVFSRFLYLLCCAEQQSLTLFKLIHLSNYRSLSWAPFFILYKMFPIYSLFQISNFIFCDSSLFRQICPG